MQLHYPINPTTGVEDPAQLPWANGVPSTGQEGSYPPFAAVVEPMTELVNLITLAGITPATADLDQVTRAVRGGQLDFDATDTGTADAMVAQVGLAHTQLQAGLPFALVKGPNSNTGNAVPTLTITDANGNNGLTGKIVKATGAALGKGDLPGGALLTMRCIAPGVFALTSLLAPSDLFLVGSVIRVTDSATTPLSTPDLLVGTTTAPIFGYATNHVYVFNQGAAPNATSTPKGNVTNPAGMALGALTFVKRDGSALSPGDLQAGVQFLATLDPTGNKLRLMGSVPSDVPRLFTASPTIYVAPPGTAGASDSNPGTQAAPLATLKAAFALGATYFVPGGQVTIQLTAPGTYAAASPPSGCLTPFVVSGSTAAQRSYILAGTNTSTGVITLTSPGSLQLVGLTVQNTGNTVGHIGAAYGGNIALSYVTLSSTSGSYSQSLMTAFPQGSIVLGIGVETTTNFGIAFNVAGGTISGQSGSTFNFNSTGSTVATAYVDWGLLSIGGMAISGTVGNNNPRYIINSTGGRIISNGSTTQIPGGAAGVINSQQYS